MWRTAWALALFSILSGADEQFNCPNNGTPKSGSDGTPIQCLPGQSSELICGAGHACFFSGLNYHCCPMNDDESDGHSRGHHSRDSDSQPISSSHDHREHEHEHEKHEHHNYDGEKIIDEDQLNNGAKCPDNTFIALSQAGLPIPCNLRTNPCPKKSMFCNKYSPIPVCCESVNTKKTRQPIDEKIHATKSKPQLSDLLPLIPTPLEVNPLQQAHFAPEKSAELIQQTNNEAGASQSKSSQPVSETVRTTTIVNHDMAMNGECTVNSIVILSDDGKPIECGRNRRCPLDSLLCHKNNNGRSFCCQIVPHDEVHQTHVASTTAAPTTAVADDTSQILSELKRQELAQIQFAVDALSEPLTPTGSASGDTIAVAGSSPPGIQPPGVQLPGERSSTEKQPPSNVADNEFAGDPPAPSHSIANEENKSDSSRAVAHAVKTHDRDGINTATAFELIAKKPAAVMQDASKIEYRPHTQGGYAVFQKLERIGDAHNVGSPADDREERKRLAQRFLLDQIKDGWPYDDKFYRGENVVVMNRGTHMAAIVHFPN